MAAQYLPVHPNTSIQAATTWTALNHKFDSIGGFKREDVYAVDLSGDGITCGSPVYAVTDGTIAKMPPWAGFHALMLKGDNGLFYPYAHLSARLDFGTKVKAGQEIGKVGTEYGEGGFSSGCHLHFSVCRTEWEARGGGSKNENLVDKWLSGSAIPSGSATPAPSKQNVKVVPTKPSAPTFKNNVSNFLDLIPYAIKAVGKGQTSFWKTIPKSDVRISEVSARITTTSDTYNEIVDKWVVYNRFGEEIVSKQTRSPIKVASGIPLTIVISINFQELTEWSFILKHHDTIEALLHTMEKYDVAAQRALLIKNGAISWDGGTKQLHTNDATVLGKSKPIWHNDHLSVDNAQNVPTTELRYQPILVSKEINDNSQGSNSSVATSVTKSGFIGTREAYIKMLKDMGVPRTVAFAMTNNVAKESSFNSLVIDTQPNTYLNENNVKNFPQDHALGLYQFHWVVPGGGQAKLFLDSVQHRRDDAADGAIQTQFVLQQIQNDPAYKPLWDLINAEYKHPTTGNGEYNKAVEICKAWTKIYERPANPDGEASSRCDNKQPIWDEIKRTY